MVNRLQGQPFPHIQDLYFDVFNVIMHERNIALAQHQPTHIVRATASFAEVFRNTEWYCRRGDSQPHYRYRRYRDVLEGIKLPTGSYPIAHVDIGCGAGLFSWAFLDRMRDINVSLDRIELYGLDHSQEMINLAHRMRVGLTQNIPNYPDLHYARNAAALMQDLTDHHSNGTVYIVTFGHVLAQAHQHQPDDIARFAQVITHICNLDTQQHCVLAAVDAKGWGAAFAGGWNGLLTSLRTAGVEYKPFSVRRTPINDVNRAKIALLSRAG